MPTQLDTVQEILKKIPLHKTRKISTELDTKPTRSMVIVKTTEFNSCWHCNGKKRFSKGVKYVPTDVKYTPEGSSTSEILYKKEKAFKNCQYCKGTGGNTTDETTAKIIFDSKGNITGIN